MSQERSYDALIRRHRRLIWWFCRRFGGKDSEDLVQEVSIALWQHYGKLRPDANAFQERAWVLYYSREVVRSWQRKPQPPTQPLDPDLADRIALPTDTQRELIDDILDRLRNEDRHIIELCLAGNSPETIASLLGLSSDAVYKRIHRIIKKLRDEYRHEK